MQFIIRGTMTLLFCFYVTVSGVQVQDTVKNTMMWQEEKDAQEKLTDIYSKYVEILSYDVWDEKETQGIKQILPGTEFILRVIIKDIRIEENDLKDIIENIVVRTVGDAFETEQYSALSDAQAESIGIPYCYALKFHLKYIGNDSCLKFHLFYRGAFAYLAMDEIDINLEKYKKEPEENQTGNEYNDNITDNDVAKNSVSENTLSKDSGSDLVIPQLLITSYNTGKYFPANGEKFNLNLGITATNGSYSIQNIKVVPDFGEKVYWQNMMDYIPKLNAGETVKISFSLQIDENFSSDKLKIPIKITGVLSNGTAIETEDEITVLLRKEPELEIIDVQMSEFVNTAWDDGSGDVEVLVKNCGNREADVDICVLGEKAEIEEKSLVIKANASECFKIKILPETEGIKKVKITLQYEDSLKQQHQLVKQIVFTAEEKEAKISHNIEISNEIIKEEKIIPTWAWFVGSMGIMIVVIISLKRIISDRINKKSLDKNDRIA